jgi:hypothetical protein
VNPAGAIGSVAEALAALGLGDVRWRIAGVNVDLMPTEASVLGFADRWYEAMMKHAVAMESNDGRRVRIVRAPCLIATKLEAVSGRGAGDVLLSRDLGDVVALVDSREERGDGVRSTETPARTFIADAFRTLLDDPSYRGVVPAYLLPDAASQARTPLIMERMRLIAGSSPTGRPEP